MQITPQPGQKIIYNHGDGVVVSPQKYTSIAIQGAGPYGPRGAGRPSFAVTFFNHTKTAIDFGLENIRATDGKGKPVRIYTAQQLEQEARTRAAIQAIAAGINAGCAAYNASQPSYTTYNGGYYGTSNYNVTNTYGRPLGSVQGYQSGSVYGTATTYNPAQAALANQAIQANTASQMQGIESTLSNELSSARSVLARTTVPPGASLCGLVVIRKAAIVNFEINVAGERHTASFTIK